MTIVPLNTYLRMYRKRAGFTHEELAFLCGAMCGSSVARHEQGSQLPVLRTALMYEFILQGSVRELYAGLFHDARRAVCVRARGLCASLERKPQSADRDHKIAMLRQLLTEGAEVIPRAT
jgi:DNA-binding XRE family transcriptional regulator